jgi:two-component system, cell cycle sensor histidine kinase and response regulator CckA
MPKALIVDDHEENLYLLRALLGAHGYDVTTAPNGLAALQCAADQIPDIIISDILMPVMDGFTLCRRWREDARLQAVPFVFYTATYTDRRDEDLALSLGADCFLVKPLEPSEFMRQIAGVLARCQAGVLRSKVPVHSDERAYLQEYNQALVRKLEDKLAALEQANRALLIKERAIESATSGIALADLAGRVTYTNPAMEAMFGGDGANLIGAPLERCCGEAAAAIAGALRKSGRWQGTLTTAGPEDTCRHLEGAIDTVLEPDGTAVCRVLSFRDVTERGRLLAQMQQNQRLSALSLFAGGVAHDFNNLLAGLFGNIDLARSMLSECHPGLAPLETAALAFERARDLTRRLLTFAIGSPPQRASLTALDVLRECCLLALSGSTSRWDIETPGGRDLWPVWGDANQLSQVFTNILVNASQAMPNGGHVHLSVCNRQILPGENGDVEPGRYVSVTISDEGPGIPDEVLPRVFDPLFTTKPSGTGLGLAMSYSIVRSHGGRITAASPSGGGARFELLLPAAVSSVAQTAAAHAETVGGGPVTRGRVILMDDEAMVRQMAAAMLTRGGYEVATANDGADVIEQCRTAAEVGKPFDAAILDVTVPGGMGGHEALKRLREAHPGLAIVLSSGYGDTIAATGDCSPAAVLPKPYRMHELLACLQAAAKRTET